MTQIAVTDAHPLIWYAKGHLRKLGPAARRVFTAAENGRCIIYVPILALVEVLEASRLGGIKLNSSADQWTEQLFSSGAFLPVNLTTEIVLRAEGLYAIRERGDRLIAATAAVLGHPLMTRDPEIARVAGVRLLW